MRAASVKACAMKPNFALTLSFDGIRLLHRVPSGWHLVGDVALDAPDLSAALSALRDTAQKIDPSGLLCKLVLPNEQIRYLTIQTGLLPDEVMREQRVTLALDGATPYDVHDLAYDWTVDGDNTHIAAVAKDTLAEAESFAIEHGFTPVSFVAIPDALDFPGEPFLGIAPSARTALGSTATVARDMQPIRVIGHAHIPQPDPEPTPEPTPAPPPAPDQTPDPAPQELPDQEIPAPDLPVPDLPVPDAPKPDAPKTPPQPDAPLEIPAAPDLPAPDSTPESPITPPVEVPEPDPIPEPDPTPAPEPSPEIPSFRAARKAERSQPPAPRPPAPPLPAPAKSAKPAKDAKKPPASPATKTGDGAGGGPISFQSIRARRDDTPASGAGRLSGASRDATPAKSAMDTGANAPSIPIDPDDLPDVDSTDDDATDVVTTDVTTTDIASPDPDTPENRLPPAPAPLAETLRQQPAPPAIAAKNAHTPTETSTKTTAKPTVERARAASATAAITAAASLKSALTSAASGASALLTKRRTAKADSAAATAPAPQAPPPQAPPPQAPPPQAPAKQRPRWPLSISVPKAARASTAADPKNNARQRAANERQRMTVFGARKHDANAATIGGKPRYLGLILTALLVLFMAAMAAFAAIAPETVSRLLGFGRDDTTFASAPSDPFTDETALTEGEEATPQGHVEFAMLNDPDQRPDYGEATGLSAPTVQPLLSPEEVAARYAATGIWQAAPQRPDAPVEIPLDDLYQTSIDPALTLQDAIALPDPRGLSPDGAGRGQSNPMAAGTVTPFDPRGLVMATPQGTLSPEGFTVFSGPPPRKPPRTPTRFADDPVANTGPADLRMATIRPRPRPGDLVEQNERTQFGGLTRSELATIRPRLRPESAQEQALAASRAAAAEAAQASRAASLANAVDSAVEQAVTAAATAPATAPDPTAGGTRLAVATSLMPKDRPRNFNRLVDRARKAQETQPQIRTAAAATVAPRTVQPSIPSKANVAKQATVKNALNLREVNLIGVYGKPSARRALVRLANGRYQKVSIGDRVDGGRVVAISDGELRYQKNGRNVTLKMPKG